MRQNGLFIIVMFLVILCACNKDEDVENIIDDQNIELEDVDSLDFSDWSDETHSKVDPNYSMVFNQNDVLRFDIVISSNNWSLMQTDLSDILGSASDNQRPGGPGGKSLSIENTDSDPIWVPCSFNFNGTQWYNVGIRYKGNSSLKSAYQSGNNKLSFKLDFDEFEDNYPDLKNQRFYGFKQLNLNNNYDDASLMREKIGADLFRNFGLVSSQTAFCVVYIDYGAGSQYFGVYTIVEEVDDTVLENQLGNDSGNLYKPDGDAASFAFGTYNESEMEKKSNEDLADYSDVKTLYEILNSDERTNNTDQWKVDLSNIFNIDNYLKWLAANIVIQNWDTYGRMTHNYYLYNNPDNNLLTWIPWDNNESLQYGKMGGALNLSLDEATNSWPLIKYIIDDDEYNAIYKTYLLQFIDEVFIPENMSAMYDKYGEMLKEFAYAEETGYTFLRSDGEFDQAIETLKTHVQSRNDAVNSYLK